MLIIAAALASLYTTCCAVYLDGPLDVFDRLRAWGLTVYPASVGKFLACPWCVGFWSGLAWAAAAALVLHLSWYWVCFLAPAYAALSGRLLEERE